MVRRPLFTSRAMHESSDCTLDPSAPQFAFVHFIPFFVEPVEYFVEVFSGVKCLFFQCKMFKSFLQNVQIFAKIENFVHLQMSQIQFSAGSEGACPQLGVFLAVFTPTLEFHPAQRCLCALPAQKVGEFLGIYTPTFPCLFRL